MNYGKRKGNYMQCSGDVRVDGGRQREVPQQSKCKAAEQREFTVT